MTSGIDVINEKTKVDEDDEKLRLEWSKLARVFDRLLFYIFAIIHVLMILSFLSLCHTSEMILFHMEVSRVMLVLFWAVT